MLTINPARPAVSPPLLRFACLSADRRSKATGGGPGSGVEGLTNRKADDIVAGHF